MPFLMPILLCCREKVRIDVLPASDAEPARSDSAWERESYTLEVEEGKMYDDILQLEIEGLEGEQMRRCQFYITNDDVPFEIINQGSLSLLTSLMTSNVTSL